MVMSQSETTKVNMVQSFKSLTEDMFKTKLTRELDGVGELSYGY